MKKKKIYRDIQSKSRQIEQTKTVEISPDIYYSKCKLASNC